MAEDGSEIVGFVGYRVHAAWPGMSVYGEIEVIAVDPGVRGRGVGRTLLDRAVSDLREAGFRRLPTAHYWLPGSPG